MTFVRYLLQLLILVSVGFGLNAIFRKSPLQIGEALVVLLIGASFFILTLMLKHAIENRAAPTPTALVILAGGVWLICLGWKMWRDESGNR